MPVKLTQGSAAENEARIEIIPLIDIMFFLLASFMLVSLGLVNLRSVKVRLPAAATATAETRRESLSVSVDRNGAAFLEWQPIGLQELGRHLSAARSTNASLQVLLSGDREARHGDILRVMDAVREAGVDRIAFETSALLTEPASAPVGKGTP